MDEMVSYIFRSMRSSELTLRGVKKSAQKPGMA